MSKNLDLKYYKIEVNDENKETKCTLKVICKQFLTQAKKKTLLEFFLKYWKCFEIERNHKVQYDYDKKN